MCELDDQDKRIEKILGRFDMDVSDESVSEYMGYLKKNLEYPCQVTGIEDFPWEDYYLNHPRKKKEYEKLKKKKPSYTDIFSLIRFEDELDDNYEVLVEVERLSDRKRFILPLSNLKATEKNSSNEQLLDDFSVWFVNN